MGKQLRELSTAKRLLAGNFLDLPRTNSLLETPALKAMLPDDFDSFLSAMVPVADPDLALLALARLAETTSGAHRDLLQALVRDSGARRQRLLNVLGASAALGDELAKRPELLAELDQATLELSKETLEAEFLAAIAQHPEDPIGALRRSYRQMLTRVAAADLTSNAVDSLPAAGAALANLAAAAVEAALAIAQSETPDADRVKFAVIGMGKTGGGELNYVSDVDVMYVVEPVDPAVTDETSAVAIGIKLAASVQKVLGGHGLSEPALWQVDAGLRPEGKQGALVRTIDSYLRYYQRWAHNWEFQALLKSRAIAGDVELGTKFQEAIRPLVWQAVEREGFVADLQAMRRRVENHIPKAEAERQIKLGKGGLRDVEFTVQLLQLVHGRTDESLRSRNTLRALAALAEGGYLSRDDAVELERAYRFLRALEHRVQLHKLRRTHLLPTAEVDIRRLGRALGSGATGRSQGQRSADALGKKFKATRRLVRDLHETLYYRPLLPAYAKLTAAEVNLSPAAAKARLAAIGYRDPVGALRHIEALTQGSTRRAALQRQLLPVLLGWFGDDFDPDQGLLAFRRLSDELGTAHWFLKLLRDSGTAAHSLAHLLGNSRYLDDALARSPETVQWLDSPDSLASDLTGGWLERLTGEAEAMVGRAETPQAAITALRGLRRRELARIAGGEVLGQIDRLAAAVAISQVADLLLVLGLQVTMQAVADAMGLAGPPTEMMIVAMGRLGGRELGYASDADVMFVHNPLPGADERVASAFATQVATQLKESLRVTSEELPLIVDADLRPEGKNGPLVRTLEAYREYYTRWASPWEAQALLRARPLVGPNLSSGGLADEFTALIDPVRYPDGGLPRTSLREIRRLKARMEAERLPRGVIPSRHLKLGPGGLSDVEWTAQLLQLSHGYKVPGLRTTSTLGAFAAAQQAGLITESDAAVLGEAWMLASRLRTAIVLASGKATAGSGDVLPNNTRELAGIAAVLVGYQSDDDDEPGLESHTSGIGPKPRWGGVSAEFVSGNSSQSAGGPHASGSPQSGQQYGGQQSSGQQLSGQQLSGQQIAENYLRAARRARKLVERLFYGDLTTPKKP